MIWCSFFIFEFIIYTKLLSFKYLFFKQFVLFCFFIINCITVVFLLLTYIFLKTNSTDLYHFFFGFVKVSISLRLIRIFLLFKNRFFFLSFYISFSAFILFLKSFLSILFIYFFFFFYAFFCFCLLFWFSFFFH